MDSSARAEYLSIAASDIWENTACAFMNMSFMRNY